MTNVQLYLAIGVPLAANALIFGLLWSTVNRSNDAMNKRIDDIRDMLRAEIKAGISELKAELRPHSHIVRP